MKTSQLLDAILPAQRLRDVQASIEETRMREQALKVKAALEAAERTPPSDGIVVLDGPHTRVNAPLSPELHRHLERLGYHVGSRAAPQGPAVVTLDFSGNARASRGLPGIRD